MKRQNTVYEYMGPAFPDNENMKDKQKNIKGLFRGDYTAEILYEMELLHSFFLQLAIFLELKSSHNLNRPRICVHVLQIDSSYKLC